VGGPLAGLERTAVVVVALRLDHGQAGPRRQGLQRQRDAGQQAAPAGAAVDGVERRVQRAGLLRQLHPDRALAGDDVEVVEGRDQHRAALARDLGSDRLAALGPAVVEAHLAAEGAHARDLHRRRVRRHDDQGRRPDELRGRRHALGVVARRIGDDAAFALLRAEPADAVVGAAELEAARALQGLGLEQHPSAHAFVQGRALDQRRTHRQAREALGGVLHVGEGRQAGRGGVQRHGSAPKKSRHPGNRAAVTRDRQRTSGSVSAIPALRLRLGQG
jgi:hypothetical protein